MAAVTGDGKIGNVLNNRELGDFVGRWKILRRIEDFKAGQTLSGAGEAVFAETAEGLLYTEQLTLTLPNGATTLATRSYKWCAQGSEIEVFFEDGLPFHHFDPTVLNQECFHACDPDSYQGHYDFSRWPAWQVTWRVTGPRKDYRLISRYERQ